MPTTAPTAGLIALYLSTQLACQPGSKAQPPQATSDTEVPDPGQPPTISIPTKAASAGPTPVVLAVEVVDNPDVVTEKRLTIDLSVPGRVSLRCTSPRDQTELHLVSGGPLSTRHFIIVQGLLDDHTYECTITPEHLIAEPWPVELTTSPWAGDATSLHELEPALPGTAEWAVPPQPRGWLHPQGGGPRSAARPILGSPPLEFQTDFT